MPKAYEKNGYIVTESAPIRIGFSHVYVFERTETSKKDPEVQYPRLVFALMSDGGVVEMDTFEPPFPEQAKKLVKLFETYSKTHKVSGKYSSKKV